MTNKRMAVLAGMMACVTLLAPLAGCRRAVEVSSGYDETVSFIYVDGENSTVSDEGTSGDTSKTPGKKNNNSNTSSGSSKAPESNTSDLEKTEVSGLPKSLKNPKITLASWYDPGSKDKTTAFYWAVQKYQELYGKNTINLVVTANNADTYKARIIALLAGNDAPELMEVKTQWMPSFAQEKLIQPVDGIVDYSKLHYQGLIQTTSINGKHYVGCPNGMWSTVLWYNKALFTKYGVKTPKEHYKENNWTWETFKETARQMTTGNVVGFSTDSLDTMLRSQKNDLVIKNADGTLASNMKSTEVSSALQMTYDMIYTYKCWNPDVAYARLNFSKGKVAMSSGVIGFFQNYCNGMDMSDIDCVPLPKPSRSADYYGAAYGIFWGIGVGCDNVEGASAFLKILAQYEDADFGKRTPLERVLNDEQLKMTRTISENAGTMVYQSLSSWNYDEFWKEFSTQNVPVATIISKYEPLVQNAIKQLQK